MAVKTITIDIEAYELLRRRKEAGQSFSEVIKAQFGSRELRTAGRMLAGLRGAALSEDALNEVDRIVADRWQSVPEVPLLRERPSADAAPQGAPATGRNRKAVSVAGRRRSPRRRG